jgi:hypothetical protein
LGISGKPYKNNNTLFQTERRLSHVHVQDKNTEDSNTAEILLAAPQGFNFFKTPYPCWYNLVYKYF